VLGEAVNAFFIRLVAVLGWLGVLAYTGYPTYQLADGLARVALKQGWLEVIGERWNTPTMFVIGCLGNERCKPVFARAWNARYDWTLAYGAGGATVVTLFVFAITTRRRRHLFNARWARGAHFAGRKFPMSSKRLETGLQLAHLWKSYPEILKNRYGYLEPMEWGMKAGPVGGDVVAVVPRPKRPELGHALVVGPTRCGKGLALTQTLFAFNGSVIVTDPKGENFNRTAALRASRGQRIRVIDPSGRGDRFDPFKELAKRRETLKMAGKILAASEKDGDNSIFADRGGKALYTAMLAAVKLEQPVLPYLRAVTSGALTGFVEAMLAVADDEVRVALTDFLGVKPDVFLKRGGEANDFLSSCWDTIITRLDPMFSAGILASSAGSDFLASELVQEPTSLYLMFAETDLPFTKTYLQLVWLSIATTLIEIGDAAEGKVKVPLLLGLDEAGIVPVPRLPDLLSTIAGRGMSAMVFVQDETQLESAYGEEGAHTIATNCDAQVYYPPRDKLTQKNLSERCGEMMLAQMHRSHRDGKVSVSWTASKRPLIAPDETRMMHEENVIVILGNRPPLLGRRLDYRRHPLWKEARTLERIPIKNLMAGEMAGTGATKPFPLPQSIHFPEETPPSSPN
jgi:type IV secretion system protein VirD4